MPEKSMAYLIVIAQCPGQQELTQWGVMILFIF